MLRTLGPEAQELAEYMSELSRQAYYAGWMQDLEFELWDAIVSGPRDYGRLAITHEHVCELRRLSAAACGWIVYEDKDEETFLPMKEWEERFEIWKQRARLQPR